MTTITSINPSTNTSLRTYTLLEKEEIDRRLQQSEEAYNIFKTSDLSDRCNKMVKIAELLEKNKEEYAQEMTLEMGKTIAGARAEVEKCAWLCRYYAEKAPIYLADEVIKTDATKSYTSYRPIGAILAVMPWNYPFWQVFRFAVPTILAGNVAVLKHASNVSGCALMIQDVFETVFPKGVFTTLIASSSQVKGMIEHPTVKAVTLTGSGPAGSAVASVAGANIKKSVLELGGSDPYIILSDADLNNATAQCISSKMKNTGQSCIGAKRLIVVSSVYDAFVELFKTKMQQLVMGDPMGDVDLGPMARHDLRDEVHQQVIDSIKKGATLLLGGYIPNSEGAYYPPTILTDVRSGMPAYDDEIFGPVASIIKVDTEQEAIRVANDTRFGLGACIFTTDIEKGNRIAREQLEAGSCFVNTLVSSDPRLPFGGIKQSGYGRELGVLGIREFVNVKTISI